MKETIMKQRAVEDRSILAGLFERSEDALGMLESAYGRLGVSIAKNILRTREDAEECVNDALGVIWNKIPPEKPDPLLPYFLRIVRNIALNRRRAMRAKKRNAGETVPLENWDTIAELGMFDETETDESVLRDILDDFLGGLKKNDRILFVKRYWFEEEISQIADELGITENNARVRLTRLKAKLKKALEKEGVKV